MSETKRQLTEAELKGLQDELLGMILEVDRICKKHGITYYLGGGTLLGAVRHQGFIPWDDDGDLIMLREDYEHFRKVVGEELDAKYFYQDRGTDPYAHYVNPKLRRNDSIFVTEFGEKQEKMHQGIFLDIFIHDKTANSKLGRKLHLLRTKACRAMLVATWSEKQYDRRPKLFYSLVNYWIRHSKVTTWEKRTDKALTSYRGLKNAKYYYDGTGEHINHGEFPVEWLGTPKTAKFCGYSLPIPQDAHNYLVYSYGDYMKMPPPEQRVSNHDIVKLVFPGEDEGKN